MKKNITPIVSALEKVNAIAGVTYNWRKDIPANNGLGDGLEYGVIAQELEKIIPELVHTDEEGWKSVEYSHLVPVLIEAMKERQAILNHQGMVLAKQDAMLLGDKTDIDQLLLQTKALEARLNKLVAPIDQLSIGSK